jgi:3-oxoacyl-[acyl-carrier protein] reductase
MLMQTKTALVTGAAAGIGESVARLFAEEGARVWLLDRDECRLRGVVDDLVKGGAAVSMCVADLCRADEVQRAIDGIHKEIASLDVLVNNVGIYPRLPFLEMTEQEWSRVLDVNLNTAYRCARLVIPRMVERRAGKVINISSVTFHHGAKNMTHYISAKGALIGFTRALAREVGEYNVHVNCITPGAIQGEGEARHVTPEEANAVLQFQSLQRRLTPIDVARACVFLATQWSDGMTGQTLNVDGGWIMH